MGIFTVPLYTLQNTRIYVSARDDVPNRQLTLYTNHVGTDFDDGYMILPVPYPQTIRFHSPHILRRQEDYFHFLGAVDSAFNDHERYRSVFRPGVVSEPSRVAAYEVEVIDSIEDLMDLNDHRQFLHETTMDELAQIYSARHWGFLLCKLQQGEYIYEPLCYSHQSLAEHLYVPSLTYNPYGLNDVHIPEEYTRFDDKYFINGTLLEEHQQYRVQEVNSQKISTIPWQILPSSFQRCLRMFVKMRVTGRSENIDREFPINYLLYNHYRPISREFNT